MHTSIILFAIAAGSLQRRERQATLCTQVSLSVYTGIVLAILLLVNFVMVIVAIHYGNKEIARGSSGS